QTLIWISLTCLIWDAIAISAVLGSPKLIKANRIQFIANLFQQFIARGRLGPIPGEEQSDLRAPELSGDVPRVDRNFSGRHIGAKHVGEFERFSLVLCSV